MDIGHKIKELRMSKSLTQKELGQRMGISQQQIAQYENGKLKPKIETLQKIADALEVPRNLIFENLNTPEKSELVKSELIELIKSLNLEVTDITDKKKVEDSIIQAAQKKSHYIKLYDHLTSIGQDKAIEQVELLTKIPEYRKDTTPEDV